MGGSPGRALAATAPSFEVVFIDETGTQRREPLSACWDVPFERVKQSRSFPSFKGQKNFPGLWWSATTGEHVGYESWVERDVAMLLDFDPEIVGFSAQPFWLLWPGEQGERKHAPDFFARRTDGTGMVIDVAQTTWSTQRPPRCLRWPPAPAGRPDGSFDAPARHLPS